MILTFPSVQYILQQPCGIGLGGKQKNNWTKVTQWLSRLEMIFTDDKQ